MKKNVLVTATGGRSVGSGIVHSLVRSSPEVSDRWNVLATDAMSFAWGLYIAPENALLPLAGDDQYIHSLKKLVHEHKINAIVPGSEAEVTVIANNADSFGDCKLICNRPELNAFMNDKLLLEKKLLELGVKYIPTFPLEKFQDALDQFEFPFVVKPTTATGGSKGVELVADRDELNQWMRGVLDRSKYCIQPYIGDSDHEYTVGVLSDKKGSVIDSIIMRRKLVGLSLLTSKRINNSDKAISTGYSQGYIIENPELKKFSEQIAKDFKSEGPLNLQIREHDGEFYIFDFHPRFSGTTPIRADVGFNEVDILLRNHLLDEKFSQIDYEVNVAVIRAFEHVIVPMNEML